MKDSFKPQSDNTKALAKAVRLLNNLSPVGTFEVANENEYHSNMGIIVTALVKSVAQDGKELNRDLVSLIGEMLCPQCGATLERDNVCPFCQHEGDK